MRDVPGVDNFCFHLASTGSDQRIIGRPANDTEARGLPDRRTILGYIQCNEAEATLDCFKKPQGMFASGRLELQPGVGEWKRCTKGKRLRFPLQVRLPIEAANFRP